ncbi:MAG: hypothetical protein PHY15_06175 [Eubacteriales bacterium]|nr:hypothetical protein [Eubacteriales bacterium]MDD4474638.1 hypothetical protein [Eubacteriales bacterium]
MKLLSTAPRASTKQNNQQPSIIKQVLKSYLTAFLIMVLLIPMLVFLSSSVTTTPLTQTYLNGIAKVDLKIPLPSGDYELTEDVLSTGTIVITGEVFIDLKGKKFEYNKTFPLFEINGGGSLTISDTIGGGIVKNSGLCVLVLTGGNFTLNSGALLSYTTSNNCIVINAGATATITGGSISSNSASTPAVMNNGEFYYTGGTVLAGTSPTNAIGGGGTVYNSVPETGSVDVKVNAEIPNAVCNISFPVIPEQTMKRTETESITETEFTLIVNKAENLFNEREVVLQLNSNYILSDGTNTIPFALKFGEITYNTNPIEFIISEPGVDITYTGKIVLDTQDIPARGIYSTQLTYSVVVREK